MLMALDYQTFTGFCGTQLRVTDGLAMGDPLGCLDDLVLDDVYQLHHDCQSTTIHAVADLLRLAACRTALTQEALLTFMMPTGHRQQAILLSAPDQTIILPLGHMSPSTPYRLISCDVAGAKRGFDRARSATFTRGTFIRMADGSERPIEQLRAGDKVQTVGHRTQIISGVADHTHCLSAQTAAVRITAETYGNHSDVVLRPEQPFFVPSGPVNMTTIARDNVDGGDVSLMTSGTIALVQLFFDTPCVFYANGLAVESHIAQLTMDAARPAGKSSELASMLQMPASGGLAAANRQPNVAERAKGMAARDISASSR